MTEQQKSYSRAAVSTSLAFMGILVMSLTMRSGATSTGPLLSSISQAYSARAGALGFLSALPCLVFAGVGLLAVPLSKRCGMSVVLTVGTVLSGAGLLLRPWASDFAIFCVLSVIALVGPALANVLVPAWIKYHEAGKSTLLVTVYGTVLLLGGAAGSAVSVPLAGENGQNWRFALASWSVFAGIAAVIWLKITFLVRTDTPEGSAHYRNAPAETGNVKRRPIYHSRTAIALVLGFGLQALNAYVQFAFLPHILVNAGYSAAFSSIMTALVNLWAVAGGLVMPFMIDHMGYHIPWLSIIFGLLACAGWIGLLTVPGHAAFVWVSFLAIGGFTFPLILALIPARSRDASVTADLSALVQPLGYVIGALGPIGFGLLLEALGSETIPLITMAVTGLLMGVTTYIGSGTGMIDDELTIVG